MTRPLSAAVIGGGWAGCAAAARLAAGGVRVTLFEAAAELGGRGRRVTLDLGGQGHVLDNGQHLMVGAYAAIARLLAGMGVDIDDVVERRPFELSYPDGWRLRASALPSPWHLVTALLGARGPTWRDRLAMARFLQALRSAGWQVVPDRPVSGWLRAHGQSDALVTSVWRPLCIAALNTAPDEASAQVFANVLRDSLGADSASSTLWVPRADLSALLPDAVARFVVARGGAVRRSARVESVHRDAGAFSLEPALGQFDAVVYAAPPAQLARVASPLAHDLAGPLATVDTFHFAPICTVYLKYSQETRLPRGFTALRDDPAARAYGQWVFDRGWLDRANAGVMAVVVSASGAHDDEPLARLCDAVARQLTAALGLPAPIAARAIVEKRATLVARPGLRRPFNVTSVPGLVLAGDWTESDYPSTLEAAVRSGEAAAASLLG